jgi:hypothetical protein
MKEYDVVRAIAKGELDGSFAAIALEMKRRQAVLNERWSSMLEIGDAVQLSGLSPRYVNGMHGKVVDKALRRGGKWKLRVEVPGLIGTRFDPRPWIAPQNLRPLVPDAVGVE